MAAINAQDISKCGAELYDKIVGFVEDLQNVGASIAAAQKSYDSALNKFSEGRGNLIRQAELLKNLGVKPSKLLPLNRSSYKETSGNVGHYWRFDAISFSVCCLHA